MKKKYFYMWYASVAILVVDFFSYCAFIMSIKKVGMMIFDIVLLAVGVALLFYSRKKLTYKDGYTAIQAIQLYRKCIKSGIATQRELRNNIESVSEIAKSCGIKEQSKALDYLKIFDKGLECYKLLKK